MLDRVEVVKTIEANTKKRVGRGSLHRSCMWYAFETIRVLNSYGTRAIMQAGSASWKIVPDDQDDGVSPNQYSYVCDISTRDVALLMVQGLLPEMHVWAAIPETNEVIDLTTRFIPRLAKSIGSKCLVEQPPYIWEDVKKLTRKDIYYKPNKSATQLVYHLIMERLEA